MEVREKALPDLGPKHTRGSLKDPSHEDGGLSPWLTRCAKIAAEQWKRLGYTKSGPGNESTEVDAKEPKASEREETSVARAVQQTFAKGGGTLSGGATAHSGGQKNEMSRDEARCVAFAPLLSMACTLRVFLHPESLDGLHMLIDSHRQWTARSIRTSRRSKEVQEGLDRAKIKALTRACAVFEGRAGGSTN